METHILFRMSTFIKAQNPGTKKRIWESVSIECATDSNEYNTDAFNHEKFNSLSVNTQPPAREFQYIREPIRYDEETYKNPETDVSTKIYDEMETEYDEMEARWMGLKICRDYTDDDLKRSDFADGSNENNETACVKEIKVSIIDDEMKARPRVDFVDKISTANKAGCTHHVKKKARRIKSRKRSTRKNVQKPKTKCRIGRFKKIVELSRLTKHSNAHKLGTQFRRAEKKIVRTRMGKAGGARSHTDSSSTTVEKNWKKRKR